MQRTHPAAPYPLLAQSFHHSIQTEVRLYNSGGDAGGGPFAVQLLLQFNNLTFKTLVVLLKIAGLKDRFI